MNIISKITYCSIARLKKPIICILYCTENVYIFSNANLRMNIWIVYIIIIMNIESDLILDTCYALSGIFPVTSDMKIFILSHKLLDNSIITLLSVSLGNMLLCLFFSLLPCLLITCKIKQNKKMAKKYSLD